MARIPRTQLDGQWHHLMNRGARRLPIFGDNDDRRYFLHLLGEASNHSGVEVHGFALMTNHYHLLARAEVPAVSRFMKSVGELYTRWFNDKYQLDGPLFRGRFRSKPILDDRYLHTALRYVHRNPNAGEGSQNNWAYAWTSHLAYRGAADPPSWLHVSTLRSRFDSTDAYVEFVEGAPAATAPRVRQAQIGVEMPAAIEWAIGVGSDAERVVLSAGGRGIRNTLRTACALLCLESTTWSAKAIADRYGYSSAAQVRSAASRARVRETTDMEFARLLRDARARLKLRDRAA